MPGNAPKQIDPVVEKELREIKELSAVRSLLEVICKTTGMGLSAIARVTEDRWTALAVHDQISIGMLPGQNADISTTLCKEVMDYKRTIAIEHASQDPIYSTHHTPRLYNIESYISCPIVLSNGEFFGTLCAIDPKPAKVREPHIVEMFHLFAELVALQLENIRRRDVAEAETVVERANSELREQFIAIMGHDLSNPLAGIDASVYRLKRVATDPPAVVQIAERISNSSRRMKLLIDDVLDFARGRLGNGVGVKLDIETNLEEAFEEVVSELQAVHPDRAMQVEIGVSQPVYCDKARVQQLLSNLLANAIVHGATTSPIKVRVQIEMDYLVIQVSNDGEPIDPDLMPKIFEAFSRGAMLYDRKRLGLGLYICAQVVRAHGGTINVSSTDKLGTTFKALLPIGSA